MKFNLALFILSIVILVSCEKSVDSGPTEETEPPVYTSMMIDNVAFVAQINTNLVSDEIFEFSLFEIDDTGCPHHRIEFINVPKKIGDFPIKRRFYSDDPLEPDVVYASHSHSCGDALIGYYGNSMALCERVLLVAKTINDIII